MDRAEAVDLMEWFNSFRSRIRMEYAQAMSLEGFAPDIIISVQQRVAEGMVEWLESSS